MTMKIAIGDPVDTGDLSILHMLGDVCPRIDGQNVFRMLGNGFQGAWRSSPQGLEALNIGYGKFPLLFSNKLGMP